LFSPEASRVFTIKCRIAKTTMLCKIGPYSQPVKLILINTTKTPYLIIKIIFCKKFK
jgi:hypothetical protein